MSLTQPPNLPAANRPVLRRHGHPVLMALLVLFILGVITIASAALWYQYNFHASLRPVQLTTAEDKVLEQKVATLKGSTPAAADISKTLVLSEREINGYLKEQGLGDQFKVVIQHGQIAAIALLPVDKETPLVGGHTVRVKIALDSKLDSRHHLALRLSDVNVGGISLPNAWLGGIKGLDLLDPQQDDILKDFAAGIKDFQLSDGEIRLVLND